MTDTRALKAVTSTVRAIVYLRLSDLRDDDLDEDGSGATFVDREQDVRDLADRLGWTVVKVIIENDVVSRDGKHRNASAFKRRKVTLPDGSKAMRVVRPGFRQVLDDLAHGRANGLLAEDLDRCMRDPRDLEDFIDVAEMHKINARSLSGSLTFTDGGTDAEIDNARTAVNRANAASRDTARRVRNGRRRKARKGEFGGGRRPFGFEADGVTVRASEAALIADHSDRVLQIDDLTKKQTSLRSLVTELREQGVPTVTGAAWAAETWKDILIRPRNAGIMVYDGEEIGKAPWEPIVKEETFRAVVRVLTDPSRNTGPGAAPRWLGTGIYLCGRCNDDKTSVEVTQGNEVKTVEDVDGVQAKVHAGKRDRRYRCRAHAHLTRNTRHVDAKVINDVLTLLSREDAVDLFVPTRPEIDAPALRAEAKALRTNLNGLAADRALGLIDRDQMLEATRTARARLDEIDSLLKTEVAEVVDAPLRTLIEAEDIFAAWEALPLANQRAVIDTLVTVTIMPSGRRGRGFNPSTVLVEPKAKADRNAS